ncbi:MAG: signal peptidase I [Candidatus Aureabacteria bacterium]|nr:signal peptidase I [Candidatus Auribacterota bacterium]
MDKHIIALLKEGRSVAVRATGLSMHPFLRPGDIVVIRPIKDRERILPGELVLYEQDGGRWVVHRVIRVMGEGGAVFLTKGDALPLPDQPVEKGRVAGKAVSIRRPAGREYSLETTLSRRFNALIAILSRWEARCFKLLPAGVRGSEFLSRLVKAPKWLLIKMLYP